MTIQSEIQRIKDNIADAYDSCDSKGATMPESLTSDNLADCIDSITGGGASGILEQIMENLVAGNNPVSVTALQQAETQINEFLNI